MKLRKAESFCMLNDHYRGIGNIDPYFDDGGGNQDLNPSPFELHHDLFFLFTPHATMKQADPQIRKDLCLEMLRHPGGILEVYFLRLLHEGINDESLASLPDLFF